MASSRNRCIHSAARASGADGRFMPRNQRLRVGRRRCASGSCRIRCSGGCCCSRWRSAQATAEYCDVLTGTAHDTLTSNENTPSGRVPDRCQTPFAVGASMPIRNTLRRFLRGAPSQDAAPAVVVQLRSPSIEPERSPPAPATSGTPQLWLYKFDSCPYCRRVQRTIDMLGISEQIEFRDTREEPQWRADLRSRTGRTQVPCLFIDGEAMFESADISAWLREQYG